MGQKVHPYGFRIGFNKTWRSRWYASKKYAELLHEDLKLRKELKKRLGHAGVSAIEIERAANKLKVNILTSRPGIIIGRKGSEVDRLKEDIRKRTQREVFINILEIDKPEIDAQLVSEASISCALPTSRSSTSATSASPRRSSSWWVWPPWACACW